MHNEHTHKHTRDVFFTCCLYFCSHSRRLELQTVFCKIVASLRLVGRAVAFVLLPPPSWAQFSCVWPIARVARDLLMANGHTSKLLVCQPPHVGQQQQQHKVVACYGRSNKWLQIRIQERAPIRSFVMLMLLLNQRKRHSNCLNTRGRIKILRIQQQISTCQWQFTLTLTFSV